MPCQPAPIWTSVTRSLAAGAPPLPSAEAGTISGSAAVCKNCRRFIAAPSRTARVRLQIAKRVLNPGPKMRLTHLVTENRYTVVLRYVWPAFSSVLGKFG